MPTLTADNSFITIAEADTILDEFYGAEEWAGLLEDQKARLLITASRMLRDLCGEQAFPNSAGPLWTAPVLKESTAFQAWFIYQNNDVIESAISGGINSVSSTTLGKTAEQYAGSGIHFRKLYHPRALRLLDGCYPTGKQLVRA